jgi:hypothetical protein
LLPAITDDYFTKEKMLAVKGKNKQKGLLVGNPAQPAQQELSKL